jgi:hypothetical protein
MLRFKHRRNAASIAIALTNVPRGTILPLWRSLIRNTLEQLIRSPAMQSEYEELLARAARCREMAKQSNQENRAHFMRIAAAWEHLALEAPTEEEQTKSAA